MKVINIKDVKRNKKGAPLFTGEVEIQTPVNDAEGADINIGYVHFPKGVRNKFHKHSNDQILIVTSGNGFIKTKEQSFELKEGDIVWSQAHEEHSHGAADNSNFTHITITPKGTKLDQTEN